jgi:hypothetical protein
MSRNTQAAASAFDSIKPILDRALRDDEIRQNATRAWTAARKVYSDLSGEGPIGAASKLSTDDHLRDGLDTTVQSLSEAIVRLSGKEPKHKRSRSWAPFLIFATVLLVLFNPAFGSTTRTWIKDTLFGSEEEFDYSTPNY